MPETLGRLQSSTMISASAPSANEASSAAPSQKARHLEAVIAQLAAHRLAIVVIVFDECDPDFPFHVRTSFGPERGIGIGPSRDAFLHLCCHRSLPRTQEFRTASSGRPDRAGRPECIAHLDSAIVFRVGVPPHLSVCRASPGVRCRSCRRASPRGRRMADGVGEADAVCRVPTPRLRERQGRPWKVVAASGLHRRSSSVARMAPAARSAVRSRSPMLRAASQPDRSNSPTLTVCLITTLIVILCPIRLESPRDALWPDCGTTPVATA